MTISEQEFSDFQSYTFLAGLIFCQLTFLVIMIEWLYPPNETPNNAKIYKMTRNFQSLARTGAPVLPATALSLGELRKISLENAFKKRGVTLTEDDCRTLGAVKETDVNYLKDRRKLHVDSKLIYGPIFTRKTGYDIREETKEQDEENTTNSLKIQMLNTAEQEDMVRKPLKRQKKEDRKKKKKKTIDALNMLTQDPTQNENAKNANKPVPSVQSPVNPPIAATPVTATLGAPKGSTPTAMIPVAGKGSVGTTPIPLVPFSSKPSRDKLTQAKSLDSLILDAPETRRKYNTKNRLKQKKSCEAIEENPKSRKEEVIELKKKRTPKMMLATITDAEGENQIKGSKRMTVPTINRKSRRNKNQKLSEMDLIEKSKENTKATPTKRTPTVYDEDLGAKTKTEDVGKAGSSIQAPTEEKPLDVMKLG